MTKIHLTLAGLGMLAVGFAATQPALANATSDQMTQGSDIQVPAARNQAASSRGDMMLAPGAGPTDAGNGIAQRRIGAEQMHEQAQ